MNQLELLVVVPAFNEARFIEGCLASIAENLDSHQIGYRIVVVDNGSADETGALAERCGATVLTIDRSSVSHARNAGAATIASKYIAFIDADVIVTFEWAACLKRLLGGGSDELILTGCQYSVRDDAGWIEKYWFKNLRDKHLNGGNIIVSRSAFDLVGGFDDKLKTGEDYDFCMRAQARGVTYRLDDEFRAIHLGYPRVLSRFMKREMWHGEGDFRSLATFIKSPVAIMGMAYFLTIIACVLLVVLGQYMVAAGLLALLIVGNLMLTGLRFPGCGIETILMNSALNMVYFIARALSLFKALGNMKNKY